jgi:FtsP/CotA-like multicopper oxidase with cupredoxin domain
MHDHHSQHGHTIDMPTSTEGLPEAQRPEVVELSDGDEFELDIVPVKKQIGEATVRMLAYNGSVPGPTLKVPQGSTITVRVANRGDMDATVHWHGIRVENRYDGTHETQAPIPVGETFRYEVTFPDAGAYWYHPHIREDYGQELGLYGNLLVVPSDADYWPPAHRELLLTLDDVLIEEGHIAAFGVYEPTHVAMGRFGNTMLVAGESDLAFEAKRGEVVRFYFTNTANTRVFNVTLPGARMKLVGADSGHYEREEFVEEALLAPSERVVVDVLFEDPGEFALEHRTPEKAYRLAAIQVKDEPAEPELSEQFNRMRTHADVEALRERIAPFLEAPPDKTLSFVAEMDEIGGEGVETGIYACPMHADVVASWAGKCPTCGMKLMPAPAETEAPTAFVCPMHSEITATWAASCPECGMTLRATGTGAVADLDAGAGSGEMVHEHEMQGHEHHHMHGHDHEGDDHEEKHAEDEHAGHQGPAEHHANADNNQRAHHGSGHAHDAAQGIEWEDDMVEVNRMTTPQNMRWKLVDRETGAENAEIDWTFRVGDQVKLRLVNEMDSDHPMPHPFHVHGAGRFLILARDGAVEPNLVWKDTVLVRTGETVDILLDVTNPGRWMAHCHIAEHHESGMMFSFNVAPAA